MCNARSHQSLEVRANDVWLQKPRSAPPCHWLVAVYGTFAQTGKSQALHLDSEKLRHFNAL